MRSIDPFPKALTNPSQLKEVASDMIRVIQRENLLPPKTIIVAPAMSGIILACAVSVQLQNDGYIIDRGKNKTHGSLKRFDGVFGDADNCLVLDDFIDTGTTMLHTVAALRGMGKTVSHALVCVNTDNGGLEALDAVDVELHWVSPVIA